jgi:hypothetical protein
MTTSKIRTDSVLTFSTRRHPWMRLDGVPSGLPGGPKSTFML